MIKNKLKNNYPEKYHDLLMSDSFDLNEFEKQKLFGSFLKNGDFYSLEDVGLTQICKKHIIYGRVSILLGALVFVCAAILFINSN